MKTELINELQYFALMQKGLSYLCRIYQETKEQINLTAEEKTAVEFFTTEQQIKLAESIKQITDELK